MSTTGRFGVDPAELLDAARAASAISADMQAAAGALASVDVHAWAHDDVLSSTVQRALSAVLAAAQSAAAQAQRLEQGLEVSARSYARSDERWVR